jgi:hypothetical protein
MGLRSQHLHQIDNLQDIADPVCVDYRDCATRTQLCIRDGRRGVPANEESVTHDPVVTSGERRNCSQHFRCAAEWPYTGLPVQAGR